MDSAVGIGDCSVTPDPVCRIKAGVRVVVCLPWREDVQAQSLRGPPGLQEEWLLLCEKVAEEFNRQG